MIKSSSASSFGCKRLRSKRIDFLTALFWGHRLISIQDGFESQILKCSSFSGVPFPWVHFNFCPLQCNSWKRRIWLDAGFLLCRSGDYEALLVGMVELHVQIHSCWSSRCDSAEIELAAPILLRAWRPRDTDGLWFCCWLGMIASC